MSIVDPSMGGLPERPPSSKEAFSQAIELLRSDRSRGFNIDVETDTMVFEDQNAEKRARIEFITAISSYLKEAVPAAMMFPAMAPVLMEVLMFGVRGFKAGRQLEEVFDEAADQIAEMKSNPAQMPGQQKQAGPDPQLEMEKMKLEMAKMSQAMEIEKGKMALAMQQLQMDGREFMANLALERDKASADVILQRQKQSADAEVNARDLAIKQQNADTAAAKAQNDAEARTREIEQRRQQAMMKGQF